MNTDAFIAVSKKLNTVVGFGKGERIAHEYGNGAFVILESKKLTANAKDAATYADENGGEVYTDGVFYFVAAVDAA